jgi:hypothetical protein
VVICGHDQGWTAAANPSRGIKATKHGQTHLDYALPIRTRLDLSELSRKKGALACQHEGMGMDPSVVAEHQLDVGKKRSIQHRAVEFGSIVWLAVPVLSGWLVVCIR